MKETHTHTPKFKKKKKNNLERSIVATLKPRFNKCGRGKGDLKSHWYISLSDGK